MRWQGGNGYSSYQVVSKIAGISKPTAKPLLDVVAQVGPGGYPLRLGPDLLVSGLALLVKDVDQDLALLPGMRPFLIAAEWCCGAPQGHDRRGTVETPPAQVQEVAPNSGHQHQVPLAEALVDRWLLLGLLRKDGLRSIWDSDGGHLAGSHAGSRIGLHRFGSVGALVRHHCEARLVLFGLLLGLLDTNALGIT